MANEASLTPRSALSMGIHTIYQEHIVFNHLNITENIFAGAEIAPQGIDAAQGDAAPDGECPEVPEERPSAGYASERI